MGDDVAMSVILRCRSLIRVGQQNWGALESPSDRISRLRGQGSSVPRADLVLVRCGRMPQTNQPEAGLEDEIGEGVRDGREAYDTWEERASVRATRWSFKRWTSPDVCGGMRTRVRLSEL